MTDSSEEKRQKFREWKDLYVARDENGKIAWDEFSPILFVLNLAVCLLRRISIFEWSKRWILGDSNMPAAYLDFFLILQWLAVGLTTYLYDQENTLPSGIVWLYFWLIAQVLQANIYHEMLRPAIRENRGQSLNISYSQLRNVFIGLLNFVYVTCLYGLIYWKSVTGWIPSEDNPEPFPFNSPGEAIYFAFTTAWTVGSDNIASRDVSDFVQATIVSQIVATLTLVSILLATTTSSLSTTKKRKRKTESSEPVGAASVAAEEGDGVVTESEQAAVSQNPSESEEGTNDRI